MTTQIIWHGHSCFEVRTGGRTVLIDPFFTDNPQADCRADDVAADAGRAGKVDGDGGAGRVPHYRFQPTLTGIEISSGQAAGVTPIKPFRPGEVISAVHSNRGLGNHVIVDHGNGVTSVYSHLDSISVKMGQKVSLDTILGLEGTTGASTGPHLHLEIRVNGQAANPRQFIDGNP
jgi:murein DD-endopeptidase MepM/ murein hydrolase activator NlpD